MCSWSLGLSIDILFVNFGRRLVSFPFFGSFRIITEKVGLRLSTNWSNWEKLKLD